VNACYVLLKFPVLSETFIRDEIDALTEAGHQVMTVSLEGPAGADIALGTHRTRSPWVAQRALSLALRRPGPVVRALRRPHLTMGLRLKVLAAAEEARRRGVDTVHAHFAYRNADAAELVGIALGTGHSFTAHAHDIFVENSQLGRRLEAARVAVTVCEYNRSFMVAEYPQAADRIPVIPCSTRLPADDDAEPPDNEVPVVLSVGRLIEKKGFDDLLAAFAQLDAPARLVIIGDGPLRGQLEALGRQLGIAERMTMLGSMDHRATLGWFKRADIFVLACKVAADGDRDSMPVVTKEAMAAGLPVVSTDEVGVPEMVDDGRTGLLVPPSDPDALAAALAKLVGDPDRRRQMGLLGRRLVAERFDIRNQAGAVAVAIGPVVGHD
jgi:glycosyltransferase involved in cell wall biosynthesis